MADTQERLNSLRKLQHLLDNAFRVPGTNIRFGWDALVGLVPWVGDLTTALMACGMIVQAHQMRVPRVVQLRMILNVAVDMFIGLGAVRRRCGGRVLEIQQKEFCAAGAPRTHCARPAPWVTGCLSAPPSARSSSLRSLPPIMATGCVGYSGTE